MSELEKREKEIIEEAKCEKLYDSDSPYVNNVELLLIKKIAELQLRLEALEATKISGDTRIGGQPKPEQNGF